MNILFLDFETTKKPKFLPWIPGSYPVTLHMTLFINNKTKILPPVIFNHTSLKKQQSITSLSEYIQEQVDSVHMLVAQNTKFELHWLRALGIEYGHKFVYDTMVADYMLSGQNKKYKYTLEDIAIRYECTKKTGLVSQFWDIGFETDEIPLDILLEYGDNDVAVLAEIYWKQQPLIQQKNMSKIIALRCESLKVTQEIEWNGMYIDVEKTQKFSDEYGRRYEELLESTINLVRKLLGICNNIPINFASNDHLSAILFGGIIKYNSKETILTEIWGFEISENGKKIKKKIPKERERKCVKEIQTIGLGFIPQEKSNCKKEGYYKTNVNELNMLKPKTADQKAFLDCIFEMAKIEKMKGTYFDGLLELHINGCVRPSINEAVTSTGRYSSSKPNLHNQPRGSTSPVKECFISRYGLE